MSIRARCPKTWQWCYEAAQTLSPAPTGKLLVVQAAVGGIDGSVIVLRLLLDTGASYTMLPVEAVEALGCDTHHPLRRVRIVAANGIIVQASNPEKLINQIKQIDQ